MQDKWVNSVINLKIIIWMYEGKQKRTNEVCSCWTSSGGCLPKRESKALKWLRDWVTQTFGRGVFQTHWIRENKASEVGACVACSQDSKETSVARAKWMGRRKEQRRGQTTERTLPFCKVPWSGWPYWRLPLTALSRPFWRGAMAEAEAS